MKFLLIWLFGFAPFIKMVSGLHFYRFNGRVIVRPKLAHNVLPLGAVADFGEQNCQYTTKVDAR